MWSPLSQICASPSQPVLPYAALQTSTRPAAGWQRLPVVLPATTVVVSGWAVVDQSALVWVM